MMGFKKVLLFFSLFLLISSINVNAEIPLNPVHVFTFDTLDNPTPNYLSAQVGLMNFAGTITQGVIGKSNQAFSFNNQNMSQTASSVLNITGGVNATISLWINYTDTTANMNILNPSNEPAGFLLATNWISTGDISFAINIDPGVITSKTTNDGKWHNIVMRMYSNKTHELFVDGVSQGTKIAGTYNLTNTYFNLGHENGQVGRDYRGVMDELYIYNRILNASEILSLNNSFYIPSDFVNLVNPTPSNNSNVFFETGFFIINTTSTVTGLSNITHNVYNSTNHLFFSNVSSNNFSSIVSGLSANQYYYFNATARNTTNVTHSETRIIFVNSTNAVLKIEAYNQTLIINTFTANLTDVNTGVKATLNATNGITHYNAILGHNYSVLLDAPLYAYGYLNTTMSNVTQTLNFSLFDNTRLDITIRDEITTNIITQPISITLQSSTNLINYSVSGGVINITAIPPGDYDITFRSINYSDRTYTIIVNNRTYQALTARLLNNTQTVAIGIYTKNEVYQILDDVLISVQRQYSGGSYATIAQGYTDVSGFIVFNLESGTNYRVILSASGYTIKQFDQIFYLANSPYTFLLSSSTPSLYINDLDGIHYYYSPINTTLQNGSITFSITTYNSTSNIAWTAVQVNGSITNVTGSPAGGTASRNINISGTTTLSVIYSFNYFNSNTQKYETYTIPLTYFINNYVAYNTTLEENFTTLSRDIDDKGWQSIIAVFIILTAIITVMQLSNNVLAGIASGFATLIFFGFIGWISPLLVVFIVGISGLLMFMERG